MRHQITLLLLLMCPAVFGQTVPGNQLVSVGYGVGPSIQLFEGNHIGILAPTEQENINKSATGIFFLNYRYFASRRFSVGFTFGAEAEKGDWYYVYMSGHTDDWGSSQVGTFSRTTYTFAPEFTMSYSHNPGDGTLYTTLGLGLSFVNEQDVQTMQPSFYAAYGDQRGPGAYTFNKFNAYYSPLGYRFNIDGHINGYFELGIGYKGIVNGGVCYKIFTRTSSTKKHVPETVSKPVIFLPRGFQLANGLQYMQRLRSETRPSEGLSFNEQLAALGEKTHSASANVFGVTKITRASRRNAGELNIKGEAWYAPNYDSFKRYTETKKKAAYNNNTIAYVVVYCPKVYSAHDKTDRINYSVNDEQQPTIRHGQAYHYRLSTEGICRIASNTDTIIVNVKFGNSYYIRSSKGRRHADNLIRENPERGELESSTMKTIFSVDFGDRPELKSRVKT